MLCGAINAYVEALTVSIASQPVTRPAQRGNNLFAHFNSSKREEEGADTQLYRRIYDADVGNFRFLFSVGSLLKEEETGTY